MANIRVKRTENTKPTPQLLPGELGLIKSRLYYGPKETTNDSTLVDALPIASLNTDNTWLGDQTFNGDITVNGGNVAQADTVPNLIVSTPQTSTIEVKLAKDSAASPIGNSTTIAAATPSAAGVMTSADKTKLNAIASGAQVNVIEVIQGNGTVLPITSKTVNITPAGIGAAPTSHNHAATNITSGTLNSERLPIVPISKGGTGGATASEARTNLDVPPTSHASTSSTFGTATGTEYGHAKASVTQPLMAFNLGATGTQLNIFARGDHRHPIDTSRVAVTDIEDTLTSLYTNKPLSANQGRILKQLIDGQEFGKAFVSISELILYILGLEGLPLFDVQGFEIQDVTGITLYDIGRILTIGFNLFITDLNIPDFWITEKI